MQLSIGILGTGSVGAGVALSLLHTAGARAGGARRARALLAALLLAACGDLGGPRTDLETARDRWAATEPAAYEMTLRHVCFCGGEVTTPVIVTVRGGVVQSRRYVDGGPLGGRDVDPRLAGTFPAVDGLFRVVEDALARHAAQIDATYDPQRGYPVTLYIDYERNVADEEQGYQVQAFRALP